MSDHDFAGFYPESIKYLYDLRDNNNKDWYESHKEIFLKYLIEPAQSFVRALGAGLRDVAPEIHAIPEIGGSIFSLENKQKSEENTSSYNYNLEIFLWEGNLAPEESSGFCFELRPEEFFISVGIKRFSKSVLDEFRKSLMDDSLGMKFIYAIQSIPQKEMHEFGGEYYQDVPDGYDPDHFNADLLKYNGFYVTVKNPVTELVYQKELLDLCLKRFREMTSVHQWLKEMTGRVRG